MALSRTQQILLVLAALLAIYSIYKLFALGEVSTPLDPTDRELVCYMDRYLDLKAAFKGDINLARQHWYKTGALEGRIPHCPRTIDPTKTNAPPLTDREARQYLLTYTDLQRLYGQDNLEAARAHWKTKGFQEGRVASQGWSSDLPSKFFLMGSRREGCKPDAYGLLKCQGQLSSFAAKHHGNDVVSLTSDNNKFCGDTPNGQVACTSSTMGAGEMFTYQKIGQSKITLRSGLTGQYCRTDEGQVVCDTDQPSAFQFVMTTPPSATNANTRSKPFPPPTTWVEPPPPPPPAAPTAPPVPIPATPPVTARRESRVVLEDTTTARDGAWWSFFFG